MERRRHIPSGLLLEAETHSSARQGVRFRRPDDRARRPFPSEPVRTLDAIHLASALAVRSTVPSMELRSLDDRIRRAGEQLGFRLQPR